ncbi:TetR/AcrR family transcriptional regulator [Pseudonocardia sp. GCM10023141]|uniref:TetR/AcrR family transcriptional regulator n=1 Tax=Pseudonocardia sp. GCM10023141 TaxID=3252653 RepID=UPI00361E3F99
MAIRPATHRASGLARREALLRATVEIVAENGVGGATHRAIAQRAGVPLSTTSYFFASLDEMVTEALSGVVARSVERLGEVVAEIADEQPSRADALERLVDVLLALSDVENAAQFEAYLDASRRPDLHAAVRGAVTAFEEVARAALLAAGSPRADEGARAFVALADGFALNRLAWQRGPSDRAALADAMRALFRGYAMAESERADWDERMGRPVGSG